MHVQDFVYIAAAAGIGATLFATLTSTLKDAFTGALRWCLNLFFVNKELDGNVAEAVLDYLGAHSLNFTSGKERYTMLRVYLTKEKDYLHTPFVETKDSQRLFFYKKAPLLLTPRKTKGDDEETPPVLTFLRWTVDIEKLLVEATLVYRDKCRQNNRPRKGSRYMVNHVYGTRGLNDEGRKTTAGPPPSEVSEFNHDWSRRPVGWAKEEFGRPAINLPGVSALSMTEEAKTVVKDFAFWHSNKRWYVDRGITWKRGYLLHGKPGSGKTSLVRALAQEFDLPVTVLDLPSMTNRELWNAWKGAAMSAPCIILMEDFDAVFHGRENITGDDGVTFDCLLNCIDGIESLHGIALFLTTNHVEHIDPALGIQTSDGSSRPGRIDVVTELPPLDHAGRVAIARRILKDDITAERLAKEHPGSTPAQFTETCTQVALKRFWSETEDRAAE